MIDLARGRGRKPFIRARGDELSSYVEEVAGLVGREAGGVDSARQDASRKSEFVLPPTFVALDQYI